MFRRIELIEAMRQRSVGPESDLLKEIPRFVKAGLVGFGNPV